MRLITSSLHILNSDPCVPPLFLPLAPCVTFQQCSWVSQWLSIRGRKPTKHLPGHSNLTSFSHELNQVLVCWLSVLNLLSKCSLPVHWRSATDGGTSTGYFLHIIHFVLVTLRLASSLLHCTVKLQMIYVKLHWMNWTSLGSLYFRTFYFLF